MFEQKRSRVSRRKWAKVKPKGEISTLSWTSIILILAVDISGIGTETTGKQRDSFHATHAELEIQTKIEVHLDEREFLVRSIHVKSIMQY